MPRGAIRTVDFETFQIDEGYKTPPYVCAVQGSRSGVTMHPTQECERVLEDALDSGDVIVGANIAYDFHIAWEHMPRLRPKLLAAAEGLRIVSLDVWDWCAVIEGKTWQKKPSLEALCKGHSVPLTTKIDKERDAEVRTTYDQYYLAPLSEYSEHHRTYLYGDGEAGYRLGHILRERFPEIEEQAAMQTVAQIWRTAASNHGMRTDKLAVGRLRKVAAARVLELSDMAQEVHPLPGEKIPKDLAGKKLDPYRMIRLDGSRNMKRIKARVTLAYDGRPPMTRKKKGAGVNWRPSVKTDKETLAGSPDALLQVLAEYGEFNAILTKDLTPKMLGAGIMHTRFWFARTTRSTSAGPNLQNFRRAPGIRECVIPSKGCLLVAADHVGLEMVTAAESAIEFCHSWDLANRLIRGDDMHAVVGAQLAGWDYEEMLALLSVGDPEAIEFRQFGKVPNFGCMGGMTLPETLCLYGRNQGIKGITPEIAQQALEACRTANPDIQRLLDWVKYECPRGEDGYDVPIPGTGLIRANASGPAAANTLFQGRGAAVELYVGWELWKAQNDRHNPLHDAKVCNFIHDEFIFDTPESIAQDAAHEIDRIMCTAGRKVCPNVPLKADVTLMRRWSKKASSKLQDDGTYTIWDVAA